MATIKLEENDSEIRPNTISETKVDASFRRVSKSVQCFQVWKIAEETLEAIPNADFGNFYDQYAYIIYAAAQPGTFPNEDTIPREIRKSVGLNRFLHFWLGEKVTEQTRSNVTHKILELDAYFDNTSTIYREIQDSESSRFLSYFRKGLIVHSSEMEVTGSPNHLYRIQGHRWLRCTELDSIGWDHFASNYVMVLVTEMYTHVWLGRSSSMAERRNGINWASNLKKDKHAVTILEDGYEQSISEERKDNWNKFLPLSDRSVKQPFAEVEKQLSKKMKIYKCTYKKSRLHLDEVVSYEPNKSDLDDNAASFILDLGSKGICLWVGCHAARNNQLNSLRIARAYVNKKHYPYSTQVVRVVEGYEPTEFIRLFPNSHIEWQSTNVARRPMSAGYGRVENSLLIQRPKMAADMQLVDNGTGARQIYLICDSNANQIQEMPDTGLVMFCIKHCYIVWYTVKFDAPNQSDEMNVGIKNIVYYWIGSEATDDTKNIAESYANQCFAKSSNKCMLVQLYEFEETPHFLQIFAGKLIIMTNEYNMNYKPKGNVLDGISFVLKCYGNAVHNTKAAEILPLTSLTAKNCYVVKANQIFVWCGSSSTGDEREMAKNIGSLFGQYTLVIQDREPAEFFSSLDFHIIPPICSDFPLVGSNTCSSALNTSIENLVRTVVIPQLFVVWTQRDKVSMLELMGYDQSDLIPECTFILDTGTICFIWLGQYACTYEQEHAMDIANNYLKNIATKRRDSSAIAVVKQNAEPNIFTGQFDNWNHNLWHDYVNYDKLRSLFNIDDAIIPQNGSGKKTETDAVPSILNALREFDMHAKFSLKILQQEVALLPPEVNPLKREEHLTHDDFVQTFKMTFYEYEQLPAWKKQELKKKQKLF